MVVNNKNLCSYCFEELSDSAVLCEYCGSSIDKQEEATFSLPTGTILLGKFIIGKVLGKGGFGVTYLAYDLKRECKVAIKEYMPDTLSYRTPGTTLISTYLGEKEESFKLGSEKFYEEARTISKFNGHPNIINVYEFFYENNTAYFVMEYIDGVDLKKYLFQKGGIISEEECISLLTPIMDALIVVHSVGILHRDISPDNIYITNNGEVKLLDFGAARQVLGEKSKSLSVVLKPGFAPIEQYQSRGNQGPWTDVYALAASMYYCLVGQVPEAAMDRLEEDHIKPISELNEKVSYIFEQVLQKALSVRGIDRYQTISEFKQAILDLPLTQYSQTPVTKSEADIIKPILKNKKSIISLAIAGVIFISVCIGFVIWQFPKNNSVDVSGGGSGIVTKNSVSVSDNEVASTNSVNVFNNDTVTQNSAAALSNNTASEELAASTSGKNSNPEVTNESGIESTAQDSTAEASNTISSDPSNKDQSIASTPTNTKNEVTKKDEVINRDEVVKKGEVTSVTDVDYIYSTSNFSVRSKYTGKWKDNKPNGAGVLVITQNYQGHWMKGDRLTGNFVNGVLVGEGKLTRTNGAVYTGNFNGDCDGQGSYVKNGTRYDGQWKDGNMHGHGTKKWSDGSKYVGEWKNGKMSGNGTYTYSTGEKYIGEFKDDNFEGQGCLYSADGDIIEQGTWVAGELKQD